MARQKLKTLSDRDIAVIRRMQRFLSQLSPQKNKPTQIDNDHQAPEAYIAKSPPEGIPALSGTIPGSGDCEIYKIIGASSGSPSIGLITTAKKRVYNMTLSDIAGDTLFTIIRDKFGSWVSNVGGGSAQTARWGRATQRKSFFEKVMVDIWTGGPPSSGVSDPDESGSVSSPLETIECVTTYPTLVGCAGSIHSISSFASLSGDGPIYEFRPFVMDYLARADADWSSLGGGNVSVSLVSTLAADSQSFNAMAPSIPGVGMDGVLGYVFGVMGHSQPWQFVPLGCVGTAGTGSGS